MEGISEKGKRRIVLIHMSLSLFAPTPTDIGIKLPMRKNRSLNIVDRKGDYYLFGMRTRITTPENHPFYLDGLVSTNLPYNLANTREVSE